MADPATRETDRIRSYFQEASWNPSDGRDWLVAERRRIVERLVETMLPPLSDLAVCDVGCGSGSDLARWSELGVPRSRLFGTELVPELAGASRTRLPGVSVETVDGFDISHGDRSFDLVTASLVLSSIRDPAGRQHLLAEMWRVTREGGLLAVYDFRVRKPWNRNVVAMRRREVAGVLGPPSAEYRLAPFLPLLDLALTLPTLPQGALIRMLPRTHRLWVWTRTA